MQPWAMNHAVRLSLFMGLAILLSQVPLGLWLRFAYPIYGAVLVALPITLLFVKIQKFYVEGVTGGAVKG